MADYLEIILKGHLEPRRSDWFSGLAVKSLEGNATLLAGEFPGEEALHKVLECIRSHNLTLLSVTWSIQRQPAGEQENERSVS